MPAPAHALAAVAAIAVGSLALALPPVVEEFQPVQDTSIYSQLDFSNGAGTGLFTGRTGPTAGGNPNRALLQFDLSTIPAGAVIQSVELRMFQEVAANGSGDRTLSLHRLTDSWGEAGSFSTNGIGAPPQAGDASWSKRFHPDVFWTTAGGDFVAAPSASTSSPEASEVPVSWTGAGLVADVEAWLLDDSTNHGWILIGDESEIRTARRLASRETSNLDGVPTLVVTYDGGPPRCVGDLDDTGDVGFSDLLIVLSAWGTNDPAIDLDGSGVVDFGDLLIILTNYGPC